MGLGLGFRTEPFRVSGFFGLQDLHKKWFEAQGFWHVASLYSKIQGLGLGFGFQV